MNAKFHKGQNIKNLNNSQKSCLCHADPCRGLGQKERLLVAILCYSTQILLRICLHLASALPQWVSLENLFTVGIPHCSNYPQLLISKETSESRKMSLRFSYSK